MYNLHLFPMVVLRTTYPEACGHSREQYQAPAEKYCMVMFSFASTSEQLGRSTAPSSLLSVSLDLALPSLWLTAFKNIRIATNTVYFDSFIHVTSEVDVTARSFEATPM